MGSILKRLRTKSLLWWVSTLKRNKAWRCWKRVVANKKLLQKIYRLSAFVVESNFYNLADCSRRLCRRSEVCATRVRNRREGPCVDSWNSSESPWCKVGSRASHENLVREVRTADDGPKTERQVLWLDLKPPEQTAERRAALLLRSESTREQGLWRRTSNEAWQHLPEVKDCPWSWETKNDAAAKAVLLQTASPYLRRRKTPAGPQANKLSEVQTNPPYREVGPVLQRDSAPRHCAYPTLLFVQSDWQGRPHDSWTYEELPNKPWK